MGQKCASVFASVFAYVLLFPGCLFVVVPGCCFRVVVGLSALFCRRRPASVDTLATAFYMEALVSMSGTTPKALSRETLRRLRVE